MQSRNLVQAELLISHHRYKDAEEIIRLEIGQNMENATAFSMLALVLALQERAQEGLPAVQRAISLEPENEYHFYIHSLVLEHLKRYEQAIQEIQKAIRLDPLDAHYYGQLSNLHIHLKDWQDALDEANKGLELDPQSTICSNLRAVALTQMGRRTEATQTIDGLLKRDPENAVSHANQGWTYLHKGDPKQASVHFREALRLQPGQPWARQGMLEALKARNILYRGILAYYLWISRFKSNAQWGLILGAYFGYQLVRTIAAASPALAPWLSPFLTAYIVFAFSTWIASPLFNLFLRLDPFGRMILNEREKKIANLVGLTILIAILLGLASVIFGASLFGVAALGAFLMILPVSGLAHMRTKKTQIGFGLYVLGLALSGVIFLGAVMLGLNNVADTFSIIFLFGWIASSWIVNYLISSGRA